MSDEQSVTRTITSSDRLAAEIMSAIDEIASRIPRFEIPHTTTAPHVRGARTIPEEAIVSMIAAVEDSPQLQAVGTFDVDNALAMLQFNQAFRQVVNRVNSFASSLIFTMEAWKAEVVFDLLRTYGVMKSLARDPEAGLMSRVEIMRRDIGRKKPRKKAAQPAEPDDQTEE